MEFKTTNVFYNNFNSNKKININRWWTRSGKTYNLLQLFFYWLIYWRIDNERFFEHWILTIVRKYASSLKWSCQRDFEEIIDYYGKRWEIEINKQDKTYKHKNRIIEFIGADDQQKLRWSKRDILYCNEANELNYKEEFFQLFIRTKYKVFIDFNPDNEDIWINTELEQKRRNEIKDVRVIISNYEDNPYLEKEQVAEIERLKEIDTQYWRIYWLWEYGKLEWVIFSWWSEIEKVPAWANLLAYWMDFWYTNDPSTLIGVYMYNGEIILDEFLYKTNLTNQDIIAELKNLWINNTEEIFADSSEPKSIEEIHRWGFNIKPVEKWPDSIMFWIDLMKQYKIFVTQRSMNMQKEFRNYTWLKDKNWKSLNKPVDTFNHCIDAGRYAIMMKLKKQKKSKFIIDTF